MADNAADERCKWCGHAFVYTDETTIGQAQATLLSHFDEAHPGAVRYPGNVVRDLDTGEVWYEVTG